MLSAAVDAPAALTGAALFFADFFATAFGAAFLTAGFFVAGTGGATFLPAATTFFAAGFATLLTDAFLAADFFFATGALTGASGDLTPLPSTRNASRFFTPAIQPGARPNPDQVAPVLGSWYLAAPLLARLAVPRFLPTMAFLTADAFRDTLEDRCSSVTPSSFIRARTLPTDAFVSSSARRAALASRAAICFLISEKVSFGMVHEEEVGEPRVYPSSSIRRHDGPRSRDCVQQYRETTPVFKSAMQQRK